MKKHLRFDFDLKIDLSGWIPRRNIPFYFCIVNLFYRTLGALFLVLTLLNNMFWIVPFLIWLAFDFKILPNKKKVKS